MRILSAHFIDGEVNLPWRGPVRRAQSDIMAIRQSWDLNPKAKISTTPLVGLKNTLRYGEVKVREGSQ